MKKDFKFTLGGNFGLFNWSTFKGDDWVSSCFISKTEVMGVLGAVVGLDGYQQVNIKTFKEKAFLPKRSTKVSAPETENAFWVKLKGIEIGIKPISHPKYVHDFLVHVDTKRINSNGNLTINIKCLLNPEFEIYVRGESIQDDELYDKLVHYLEEELSEFIPYLGKNQYRAHISDFKFVELSNVASNEIDEPVVVDSVYPIDLLEDVEEIGITEDEILDADSPYEYFTYVDEMKLGFEPDSTKLILGKGVWSNSSVNLNTNEKLFKDDENKLIYLF